MQFDFQKKKDTYRVAENSFDTKLKDIFVEFVEKI